LEICLFGRVVLARELTMFKVFLSAYVCSGRDELVCESSSCDRIYLYVTNFRNSLVEDQFILKKQYNNQGSDIIKATGDWISASCLPPAPPLIVSPLWPLGHGDAVDLGPHRWERSAPCFEGFVVYF
jgi:hypothetical protein